MLLLKNLNPSKGLLNFNKQINKYKRREEILDWQGYTFLKNCLKNQIVFF
jgi:hypothetical protein